MNKVVTYNLLFAEFGNEFDIAGNKENLYFDNAKPINEANENSIVWVSPTNVNKLALLNETKAKVIVCDESLQSFQELNRDKILVITNNPRLFYLRIVKCFFEQKIIIGIHESALIHPEAEIAKSVSIGPMAYIGKCKIGEGTIIHGRCYVYDNVTIGRGVIIQAGTVIGSDGFGYAKNEKGELEKFPHIGNVVIEDDVEIGANTCIDKGTLGTTLIKRNAKIDNLVHIAHNVVVGENAAVIANSMVGGSTTIGDNTWISPSVSLRDGLSIGKNVLVGMGSVVTKNIPDNEMWAGNPAMPLEQLKSLLKKWKEGK